MTAYYLIAFNIKKIYYYLFGSCLLLICSAVMAQNLGGQQSFTFVNLPSSVPLAALGGITVSLRNHNVNLFTSNPALLNSDMDKYASVNYVPYYAGIKYSSLAYVHKFEKVGRWGAALQYLDYGTFQETDPSGNVIGSFKANEYIVTAAHARTIGSYTLGANLKFAGSSIANYTALATMLDIGINFKHPLQDLSIGLLIKNVGFALKKYYPEGQLSLPFDIQVGTSFKPKFMPLRFSFTAHHLHKFDIAYDDPVLNTVIDRNGNKVREKVGFIDKLARHFVLGTEILLSKAFQLQFGYNHLIRQELRLSTRSAGAGFSFGASLRVKSFEMAYARVFMHAASGISYLTLNSNLGTLLKKKDHQK